jgi:hypothetical protein
MLADGVHQVSFNLIFLCHLDVNDQKQNLQLIVDYSIDLHGIYLQTA